MGWRNLPTLRVGWRIFFSSCAVVSVFCSGGKHVLVLYTTYVLRVSYHTVVVLCQFFWFWREIVFGFTCVLSVQYSCAVVLVFWLWREIVSSVWRVRNHYYDQKKKIQSSVWPVRDHYYDRKKKIQSSVWRVRDHVCLSCCDRYICISST